jgi:uncharacterized protein YjbI with pentapeptide repeats
MFFGAQLQGANPDGAQLQGAVLAETAQLEGASLRRTYVWRTYPTATATGARIEAPETGPKYSGLNCRNAECEWSERSYAALKSLIEKSVPLTGTRNQALRQIAARCCATRVRWRWLASTTVPQSTDSVSASRPASH